MQVDCPKCASPNAWYQKDRRDVILRCLCGHLKVVSTTLGNICIEHIDVESEVKLPRRTTKLYQCLSALCGLEEGTTQEIAEMVNFGAGVEQSLSDVASQLTVLRYKGLVRATTNRKGVPGGSTWVLTDAALKLIKGV